MHSWEGQAVPALVVVAEVEVEPMEPASVFEFPAADGLGLAPWARSEATAKPAAVKA
jgi:hypothetical protein